MLKGKKFDASALVALKKSSHLGRGTHVPRSGYTCTSVGVRMYLGRGTMTNRFLSHNFQLPFKQQLSLHEPLPCVVLNDNRDNRDNILFKLCATNFSRLLEKFITQKKLSLLSLLSLLSFKTTQAIIDCLYYKKPEETYCYKNTEETYYYKNTENQYGKKRK